MSRPARWYHFLYSRPVLWLGGPRISKKMKLPNHAHRTRLQKLYLAQKKSASESHAGESSFF
jgi:hypothetical protein